VTAPQKLILRKNMEIYFDARELYKWLDKDIIGGEVEKLVRQMRDDSPWKAGESAKSRDVLVGRGFGIPPSPLPLPFSSIDSTFSRVADRYAAAVDLNYNAQNPCTPGQMLQVVSLPFSFDNSEITACIRSIPKNLKKKYGDAYSQMGKGVDGYILQNGGKPTEGKETLIPIIVISEERMGGFIRIRAGGNGTEPRVITSPDDFECDMRGLERVVNDILNIGVEAAMEREMIKCNPKIMLRFGPPV